VVEAASFSLGELARTKRASDFYKGFSRKKIPKNSPHFEEKRVEIAIVRL
jgi:hypothetical protein